MNSLRAAYEELVYPSAPRAATAPDRLAAVAALFGVAAKDPATARVLEIGCSDGGNLAALAVASPQAQFLGIDFSANAIARGQPRWRALALENLELRALDLTAFPADAGAFDYIIAHGVFSWVSAEVRAALLALVRRHLAPNGVAYIDYNAQPGSQLRYAFRESILFHVRRFSDPQQRIDQARALLKLIIDANPPDALQRVLAEAELSRLQRTPDAAVFHDMLAVENQPFYFHEFAAAASRHGLHYLAEADLHEMSDALLPAPTRERLAGIRNLVEREQYLDILKSRVFRQTLLCPAESMLDRTIPASALRSLFFSAAGELAAGEREDHLRIQLPFGSITTAHPQLRTILSLLAPAAPGRFSFAQIVAALGSGGVDVSSTIENEVALVMRHATLCGMVNIHAQRAPFTTTIEQRPTASPLAREQAARGEMIFTLDHRTWQQPDEAAQRLLPLLDGTRDLPDLSRELGWPSTDLDAALRSIARRSLLLASAEPP